MKKTKFLLAASALAFGGLVVFSMGRANAQTAGRTITLIDASNNVATTAPIAQTAFIISGSLNQDVLRVTDAQGRTCDMTGLDRHLMAEVHARIQDAHTSKVTCSGTMGANGVTAALYHGVGAIEID